MMLAQQVLAQAALLAGPLDQQQMELLKVLSHAAASSLKNRLRNGLTEEDCRAFESGLLLDDGLQCMPAGLKILSSGEESEAHVTLREGKFHQVKRMLAYLGKPVLYLERISMGNMTLDSDLPRGKYRFLTPEEVEKLRSR